LKIINEEKLKLKMDNTDGDWGLGIGDWGLGIGPNPQSPIPNPHSPNLLNIYNFLNFLKLNFYNLNTA
jgi:hypothetical protein